MSFSSDVKEELSRQYGRSRHCQLAELAGMLEMSGRIQEGVPVLDTDNPLLQEKYGVLMQKAFSVDVTEPLTKTDSERILSALRLTEDSRRLLVQQTCCKRAFLRGAFMASGSISDPNKSYHFEIVARTLQQAQLLTELMNSFEADAKIVERIVEPERILTFKVTWVDDNGEIQTIPDTGFSSTLPSVLIREV